MKIIATLLLLLTRQWAGAQEIAGRVLDEKKEPLISAMVQVSRGPILKGRNVTDFDGNYSVKPLDPGYYNVLFVYAGCDSILYTDVIVGPKERTTVNLTVITTHEFKKLTVRAYKKPIVYLDPSLKSLGWDLTLRSEVHHPGLQPKSINKATDTVQQK